eukprot:RCo023444
MSSGISEPLPFGLADVPEADWDSYVADFRKAAHQAVDQAADLLSKQRQYSVVPQMKPGELIDRLPPQAPDRPENYATILQDFDKTILPAVTHWNHPGFMAFFGTTGSTPAIIAELLAATLNTNGLHWKTSPAVVELEQVTLGWLREWLGLPPEFFGIIYDTASVSTMHALVCARELVAPQMREEGANNNLTVYCSDQAHSSVEKSAIAVGYGQRQVRKVASDSEFRMKPELLEDLIRADLAAGLRPACVVATIGTTSSASVDPVAAIAEIAERYDLWFHVDAAYAGPCALLPECQQHFAGIQRAHSFVTNPHKWMMTPIDLSAFYTRKPKVLRQAFSLVPEYLRTVEDPRAVHLMDYGIALGHRFRALKLWFLMRYFGKAGVQAALRHHIALAQKFSAWVDADPRFERIAPVLFSTVCFRAKGTDELNHEIIADVHKDGRVFFGHTSLNKQTVLRVTFGNLRTSEDDVALAWKLIQQAADSLMS